MNTETRTITLTVNGSPRTVTAGKSISEYLGSEQPCGGHGRCGKCKVIATGDLSPLSESEKNLLTEEELKKGFRFACLTAVLGDCSVVTLQSDAGDVKAVTDGEMPEFPLNPAFVHYGAAIDIGTTTIAAGLYDTDGTLLCEAACLNPQIAWGADVISRIEAALDGKAESLALSIRSAIDDILAVLARKASVSAEEIDGIVLTGNTVMLYLLTETDTEPLSHAPFTVHRSFGETVTADALGLSCIQPDTPVYLPPCMAAFIGADITCGILATRLCESAESALFADIGTNGEMGLWTKGKLTVCSTAAGPAFEGVGISMGMRGAPGAIDKVAVHGNQAVCHVIGDKPAVGICGSGLVDAAACLLRLGILDETGYLEEETVTLKDSVTLDQSDIRMLQLAKSAICAGMTALSASAGIQPEDVDHAIIAGGFGKYLDMGNAEYIGLIPAGLQDKIRVVGNASLTGAAMLLLSKNFRDTCYRIAGDAEILELSTDSVFVEQYMMGMMF
ncbi:MAG: DUF4445 domain-containing protein [Clostridia bacterium]|nr:DUF4445 domain-containing protein [Clostridia bacterium]